MSNEIAKTNEAVVLEAALTARTAMIAVIKESCAIEDSGADHARDYERQMAVLQDMAKSMLAMELKELFHLQRNNHRLLNY